MGTNCTTCMNSKITQKDVQLGSKNLDSSFTNQIIKIQSTYRGHIYRLKSQSLDLTNQMSKKNSFIIIEKSKITQNQLDILFQTYSPLNDKIEVSLIHLSFPNLGEYSGEWNPKKKNVMVVVFNYGMIKQYIWVNGKMIK